METNMEATIVSWGYIGYNGKEYGSYHSILGLYRIEWKTKRKLLQCIRSQK